MNYSIHPFSNSQWFSWLGKKNESIASAIKAWFKSNTHHALQVEQSQSALQADWSFFDRCVDTYHSIGYLELRAGSIDSDRAGANGAFGGCLTESGDHRQFYQNQP
ncbi:MAG TPA: hypothetical protein PL166_05295 [Candidatus Contendobacter sp.]|nr:hypothetical protein [Candidatus Contendobacter sp.]